MRLLGVETLLEDLARTSHKNLVVAFGLFHCMQTERKPRAVQ
jgi:hypothetical protein